MQPHWLAEQIEKERLRERDEARRPPEPQLTEEAFEVGGALNRFICRVRQPGGVIISFDQHRALRSLQTFIVRLMWRERFL